MAKNWNNNNSNFQQAPFANNSAGFQQGGNYQVNNAWNGQNNQQKPRKKSGAKSGSSRTREGEIKLWVSGWKGAGASFMTCICGPYGKTETTDSKTGRKWQNWIAKFQPKNAAPFIQPCLYDMMTGKVVIGSMGLVINPKAANGGYFGTYVRK